MTRLDTGMTPEQEAWVRSLPHQQRFTLLVVDALLQLGVVAFVVWVSTKIPVH